MVNLLQLDCSADGDRSRSRAMTAAFADAFRAAGTDATVVRRDLLADPLPHLPDAALHWPAELRLPGPDPDPAAAALQQTLLDELLAADVLVVGVPLYNYSLPSTLKAWVDYIHVPGVTNLPDKATAPLAGRPAVLAVSRGGCYDAGTVNEGRDHATPVLELLLGTELGMDVTVVATELTLAGQLPGLADQRDRSERELAEALRRAAELGGKFGAAG